MPSVIENTNTPAESLISNTGASLLTLTPGDHYVPAGTYTATLLSEPLWHYLPSNGLTVTSRMEWTTVQSPSPWAEEIQAPDFVPETNEFYTPSKRAINVR